MSHEDDEADEDDLDDRESPDPADVDDSDSVDLDTCPYCGRPVYEQAEVCPHCNNFISREDSLPSRKPLWIIAGVIVTLVVIVVCWVFLRL